MRRFALASTLGFTVAAGVLGFACSSNDNGPTAASDGGADGSPGPMALDIACNDSIDSIYADPGPLPAGNGTIIRCAKDTDIPRDELYAKAQANTSGDSPPAQNLGYGGKPFTSGAKVYRVLFTTERGDVAKTHGYESAKVFIPDTPRAAKVPTIIGARGSRGQAAICAASKEDPINAGINGDYEALAYPIVGLGYPIIVPDLAGYANFGGANNPISGYAVVEDVAKGTLDGARALANMFGQSLTGQVVMVGHSQGGHSALAALAYAKSYAPELNIAGVATYAPLWFNQRSWGAIFQVQKDYPIDEATAFVTGVTLWYTYTHGELLDGPGHGVDPFAADKKAGVKQWIENDCWNGKGWDDLRALALGDQADAGAGDAGAPTAYPSMLFDPAFVSSVKFPAATGQDCKPGDDVCAKWIARYLADRPSLKGITTPILVTYGGIDHTIFAPQMKCVVDRLDQDQAKYQFCLTYGLGHGGNVRRRADYVVDWITARTLGGPEPAACDSNTFNLQDDAGGPVECPTLPPND